DPFPAGIREPLRLGFRREARPLDHHDRAPLVDRDAVLADHLDGDPAQLRVIRLGRADVTDDRAVEEGVGPTARPVDELVAYDKMARLDRPLERARRTRADHGLDPQRLHPPHVRPVIDPVWRQGMASTVARQECDRTTGDIGQEVTVGRRAVRGVDLHLSNVVEERIEARASEDADLRPVSHATSLSRCPINATRGARSEPGPGADSSLPRPWRSAAADPGQDAAAPRLRGSARGPSGGPGPRP